MYSGSSPSEPESVTGEAVTEATGGEAVAVVVAEKEERRRLRVAAAGNGMVWAVAEVGVTSRFCISCGSLAVEMWVVWQEEGVGVPPTLALLTAAQRTTGATCVFGDTEGESGIWRRGSGVEETMAAPSSSLWKGLSRCAVSMRGRTGRARRRLGSVDGGAERGMGSMGARTAGISHIGVLRSAGPSARQPSASRAQTRTTSGSMVNLAKPG